MKWFIIVSALAVLTLLIASPGLARSCTTTEYSSNDWTTVCDDGWSLYHYNPLDPFSYMMQCCWYDMYQRNFKAAFPNYTSTEMAHSVKVPNSAGSICGPCGTTGSTSSQSILQPVAMPSVTPSASLMGKIAITSKGTRVGKTASSMAAVFQANARGNSTKART
jgi:hypothetical protein